MPTKTRAPASAAKAAKTPKTRMSLAEVMKGLEAAGAEKTRQTYLRQGAQGPVFGVAFGTLKQYVNKIGIDHDLALQLWDTGNVDARHLAAKLVDPAEITPAVLDRWAKESGWQWCMMYTAAVAGESPHGRSRVDAWLASRHDGQRAVGWYLVGTLASLDPELPNSWFEERIAEIEKTVSTASNAQRGAMNQALIQIGGRNAALRKAVLAASKRIGAIEVGHGDTSCKTPDPAPYLAKMWERSDKMGFASPAAQERARESMRTRC